MTEQKKTENQIILDISWQFMFLMLMVMWVANYFLKERIDPQISLNPFQKWTHYLTMSIGNFVFAYVVTLPFYFAKKALFTRPRLIVLIIALICFVISYVAKAFFPTLLKS